ncbi:RING-H2 finger protein ATL22-like [Syzygium oleosum]|uniref:RING-H2 finger protein ATL22-like n=1 Tax=Syzygium oleosum TaxID=219896 RepID=UPI0011D1D41D|nr:RING-H2 finger protein ATL22-like [Syzygium oleosum]
MASSAIFLLFSSSFLVLLVLVTSDKPRVLCPTSSCNPNGPSIRLPFRIRGLQDECCSYPGFEISCDNQGQAILHLPHSGDLVVRSIGYADQLISLGDPDGCLPKRLLATRSFSSDLASASSPFLAAAYENFTLANCTWNLPTDLPGTLITCVDCLDGAGHMAVVASTDDLLARWLFSDHRCYTWTVLVPETVSFRENITEGVWLKWDRPDCRSCEAMGGRCGLKSDNGSSVVKCAHYQGMLPM